jgi:hypothetical protein
VKSGERLKLVKSGEPAQEGQGQARHPRQPKGHTHSLNSSYKNGVWGVGRYIYSSSYLYIVDIRL